MNVDHPLLTGDPDAIRAICPIKTPACRSWQRDLASLANAAGLPAGHSNRPGRPFIELAENPDILREIAALPNAPFCVGFAAESENLLAHARAKRIRKNVPMLVANQVSDAMGKATNKTTILDDGRETMLPEIGKDTAAQAIVERLAELLG